MVQSLNTRAIVTLASVLRHPSLLVPHISVDDVSQIDFDSLKSKGKITAVVFDKDNTLSAPYVNELHPKAVVGLRRAQEVFGKDRVAILSNSAGTGDDFEFRDAVEIEQSLGVKVIRHQEKKPGGMNEVIQHFGLDKNESNDNGSSSSLLSSNLCVVGDRLLTDIVFGNLHGSLTVHTMPLCQGKENSKDNFPAKLIRSIENFFLYRTPIGRYLLKHWKPRHKNWTPLAD